MPSCDAAKEAAKGQETAEGSSQSWYERNWRWWVLATLFLATFLNYLDRQTLSVAADPIASEFGLSNAQRGELLAAFVYTYALAHLFVGGLVDRVKNIRRLFPVMVVGWSVSNMLVAFADGYATLLGLRYLLGVWEAAHFPVCLLIIARIFPAGERAFAAGVFNSGAVAATLVAPKLVIFLSSQYDWRLSFLVTGLFGFLWVVPWLLIFRKPRERAAHWPRDAKVPSGGLREEGRQMKRLLRKPAFWGVALAGVGLVPGWYFASQWLPSYLTQAWGLPYGQVLGNRLTLIYLVQDAGLWIGGGLVWLLARSRRCSILSARKGVIALAYVLMMAMLFLPGAESVTLGVALLCVYAFGLAVWQANQQAFKQDVAPRRVATVAALVGFAETMASAFFVDEVGSLVQQTGGFDVVFFLFAGLLTFALIAVFALLRPKWIEIA